MLDLQTPPVLLTVFRRPETTRDVVNAIRVAKPSRLYVAADGPREGNPGEAEACRQAREIATSVDWHCDVRTLFSGTNLGCRKAMTTALDWFFSNEPEGIVLEDDVVPAASFFQFCAELLARYRLDDRISMIGGTNFQRGIRWGEGSYYASRMHHVWGWASWRRAWALYDRDLRLWPDFKRSKGFARLGLSHEFAKALEHPLEAVASGRLDTWDYQWAFTGLAYDRWSLIPQVNMVTNIGFGPSATHTHHGGSPLSRMAACEIEFPLRHPAVLAPVDAADRATITPPSIVERVLSRVRMRLGRSRPGSERGG